MSSLAQLPRSAISFKSAIDRFFEISLYLLIVTGFATLASTGRLDALSVFAVAIALVYRGYLLLRERTVVVPEKLTTYLTVLYVVFYGADYFLLSGSFVTATVHLVLFSMVVKIFSVQRERDHVYLAVLSFLEVLAAAVLTVDTMFLAAFCVFMVLAVATFISMEMRRSAAEAGALPAPPVPRPQQRLARSLSFSAISLMLAIIVGAAGIFFILPRLSAGYLSNFAPHNDFVTGFSDTVQLGMIGRIKQSDTVFMHVQIDGDAGGYSDLKWRGMALANFDGRTWTNPASQTLEPLIGASRFDLFTVEQLAGNLTGRADQLHRASKRLRYHVSVEPIGTNLVFLAPVPVALYGKMREIAVDDSGSVYNIDHSRLLEGYDAISFLPDATVARANSLAGGITPRSVTLTYLQLPNVDRRIPALAQEITKDATTNYDKAAAVELWLRTHLGYSLEMPSTPPADPLAYFLFQRKEGHCEYFASAMAVMLRTLGIPSRVVNGFRTGEYNDVTGSYIIRGRDAHSWVEAYLPGNGWTSFDPTPPDPKPGMGSLHRFLLYMDAMREFWREWVINYDFLHQQNLTLSAMLHGRTYGDSARLWVRRHYAGLLQSARQTYNRGFTAYRRDLGIGILALGLLFLMVRAGPLATLLRQARVARNPQRSPVLAASIWYTRLTKRLARRGWRKLPAQTPEEYAASIEDPVLRAQVERFTERYERARFGHSAADAQQLPGLYEQVLGRK